MSKVQLALGSSGPDIESTTNAAPTPTTKKLAILDDSNHSLDSWTDKSSEMINGKLTSGIPFVIASRMLIIIIIMAAIIGSNATKDQPDCVGTGTAGALIGTATEITCQDEVEFHPISLTISEEYDPELSDTESVAFAKKEQEICDQVITLLASLNEPGVIGCVVESFRLGSTVVDLTLVAKKGNGLITEKIKMDIDTLGKTSITNFEASSVVVREQVDIGCKTDVLRRSQKAVVENPCLPNPCKNAGTCYAKVDDFLCECAVGYDGKICSEALDCVMDPALPSPCNDHGECKEVMGFGKYCICDPGYTGVTCETAQHRYEEEEEDWEEIVGKSSDTGIPVILT